MTSFPFRKEVHRGCQQGLTWDYFLSGEIRRDFGEYLEKSLLEGKPEDSIFFFEQQWGDCRILIFQYPFHFTLQFFPPEKKLSLRFKVLLKEEDREKLQQRFEKILVEYLQ